VVSPREKYQMQQMPLVFYRHALGAREGQIPATARVTGAADGLMRPRYHPLTHLPRL